MNKKLKIAPQWKPGEQWDTQAVFENIIENSNHKKELNSTIEYKNTLTCTHCKNTITDNNQQYIHNITKYENSFQKYIDSLTSNSTNKKSQVTHICSKCNKNNWTEKNEILKSNNIIIFRKNYNNFTKLPTTFKILDKNYKIIGCLCWENISDNIGHWYTIIHQNKNFFKISDTVIQQIPNITNKNIITIYQLKKSNIIQDSIDIYVHINKNRLSIEYNENILNNDIPPEYINKTIQEKYNYAFNFAINNIQTSTNKIHFIIYNNTINMYYKNIILPKWKKNNIHITIQNILIINKQIQNVMHNANKIDTDCWKFNTNYIKQICTHFKLKYPQIDCFASCANSTCKKYISLNSDGTENYINFFENNIKEFNQQILWANPPYTKNILQKTIDIFTSKNINKGFLLIPTWSNQKYWKNFKNSNFKHIIFLPQENLFKSVKNNYKTFSKHTHWAVSLFIFDNKFKNQQTYFWNNKQIIKRENFNYETTINNINIQLGAK
jgi:hypothetical protein